MRISIINLSDKVGVLPQLYFQCNTTGLIVAGLAGSAISSVGALGASAIAADSADSQTKRNQNWQSSEWSRQFELTNERQDELNAEERAYNTPVAQSQRLQAAGFNPAALAAGTAQQLAQASPDVTAHSPATPTTQPVTPNDMGISNMMQAIGSLVNNLASAQKNGADTSEIMSLLDSKVKSAVQQLDLQDIVIKGHKLEYFVQNQIKDVRVKKAVEEYLNLSAKTFNEHLVGKELDSRSKMLDAQASLFQASKGLTAMEQMRLAILVDNYQNLLDSQIGVNRAKSTEAYSAAGMYQSQTEYNYALAQTENQMREGKISMQQLQNESIRIANTVGSSNMRTFVATEKDRLKALVSEYERQGFITETARANMQQAITNANWSEVEKYLGAMSQALNTVTGVYNAGSMRIGSMSQMQRSQVQSEFNRILDSHWQPNEPKPIHGFGYNVNP